MIGRRLTNVSFPFQYEYFFEDGATPVVVEHAAQEPAMIAEEKSQTDLLLDNVQKIERKPLIEPNHGHAFSFFQFAAYKDQLDKSKFMFKFVQVARNRKAKKKSNRKMTISSMTSDTMSIGSSSTVSGASPSSWNGFPDRFRFFQSTEYKISETKAEAIEEDGLRSSFSVDDSSDLEDSGKACDGCLLRPSVTHSFPLRRFDVIGRADPDAGEQNPLDADIHL